MAGEILSTQTNNAQNTGPSNGVVRDINASGSLGEFLNNLGASTSSAMTGAVTIGDRIIGSKDGRSQFGLVKILAIAGLGFIAFRIYEKTKK